MSAKTTKLPVRSASSLTDAKRPGLNVHLVKGKEDNRPTIKPTRQPAKQPLSTIVSEVEYISNRMDSAVSISASVTTTTSKTNMITSTPAPEQQSKRSSRQLETPPLSCVAVTMTQVSETGKKAIDSSSPVVAASLTAAEAPIPVQDLHYFESVDMDKRDVDYYKQLVAFRQNNLETYCKQWDATLASLAVPDDVQGDVRAACGKAKLLIAERFDQFADLIRQCESAIAFRISMQHLKIEFKK